MTAVPVAPIRLGALDDCRVCGEPARYQVGPDRRSRFCNSHVGDGLDRAVEGWDGWGDMTVTPVRPSARRLWAQAAADPFGGDGA